MTPPVGQTDEATSGKGEKGAAGVGQRPGGEGHVTHITSGPPTSQAIADVAGAAGAVPFSLTHVSAGSIITAAAIVLHTESNASPALLKSYSHKSAAATGR